MIRYNLFIARILILSTILAVPNVWGAAQEAVAGPVILHSDKEMYDYGQRLFNLVTKDTTKLRDLNAKAREKVVISPDLVVNLSDYESYEFNRAYVFSFSEYMIANKIMEGKLQSEGAGDDPLSHYTNAIERIGEYFDIFNHISSDVKSVKDRMLGHRVQLQTLLGKSYTAKIICLVSDYNNLSMIGDLAQTSIATFQDTLKTIEKLKSENGPLYQSIASLIPETKIQLVQAFCMQGCFGAPAQKKTAFSQARQVRKEFSRSSSAYREASKLIEIAGKNRDSLIKLLSGTQTRPGALRDARFRNYDRAEQAGFEAALGAEAKAILGEEVDSLWNDVKVKHQNISNLGLDILFFEDIRIPEKRQGIIDAAQAMENTIASRWQVPLQDNLTRIYEYYKQVVGADQAISHLRYHVMALMHENRFEEALSRAEILLRLSKNNGKDYVAARILHAVLKNLLGEPEAWIALVEDSENIAQAIANQKSEAQQLSRSQRRNKIKKEKKKTQARQQKEAEDRQSLAEERTLRLEARRRPVEAGPAVSEDVFSATGDNIDEAVFRAAKLQRHAEAEVRRAEQAADEGKAEAPLNVTQAVSSAVSLVDKRTQERELLLASSPLKFDALYPLSGRALGVNQSIEDEEWSFTREELLLYFKAVGCNIHEGPHTKVGLPEATYIKMGDEVITIFNTFAGGALTLPAWEQDRVPAYLKKQILSARDRLRAFAIKTRNIAEGTAKNQ